MDIIVFAALFLPVMLSGLSIFAFKTSDHLLKLILSFSGAYLLSISFTEIIPEIYSNENKELVGFFILLGFFTQLILDFLTKGVEHGHQHSHIKHEHKSFPAYFSVIIGVCIHSFLEGMPLANNFSDSGLQHTLLIGIVIHNIPISIVLMGLLLQTNKNIIKPIILLSLFAFSAPLGTLLCNYFGSSFISNIATFNAIIMAMVVGIFLHISTIILFESDEKHGFNFIKLASIIIGVLAAVSVKIFF